MVPHTGNVRTALGRLLIVLATSGVAAPGGRCAHELRADWAAPATLETLEIAVHPASAAARAEVRASTPYGVPELTFHAVRLRLVAGDWKLHAASLRHPAYAEWHAGLGRDIALGGRSRVLAGLRLFGIDAGGALPPCVAASAIVTLCPGALPFLKLRAGVVDAGLESEAAPVSVAFARVQIVQSRAVLMIDRSISGREDPETTILLWFGFGPVGWVQGYRWCTGEVSAAVTLRWQGLMLTVGERWHPQLGSTPRIALAWTEAVR